MKSQLAFDLVLIALGDSYLESALHAAANHPVATKSDGQMIRRYYNGLQNSVDHIRLQELANEIERYEAKEETK